MAILEKLGTRVRCPLRARHMVGRSNLSHLRLGESNVSAEHAMISWNGREWEVHDLGSRNGTLLEGRRLAAGERAVLALGMTLGFGIAGALWRLIEDSPPTALALPREGGEPMMAERDLLVLPSSEQPLLTIYRDGGGDWVAERDGAGERITEGDEVAAGGRRFVLHLPTLVAPTWENTRTLLTLQDALFCFAVSRDEEHIALTMVSARGRVDLGARSHHALLLALARARLADAQTAAATAGDALPETSHGWVYLDDLARGLVMDEMHLNVAVYRCRQQLGQAGLAGAPGIIERRKPTRQMRLGTSRVEITIL